MIWRLLTRKLRQRRWKSSKARSILLRKQLDAETQIVMTRDHGRHTVDVISLDMLSRLSYQSAQEALICL